MPKVEVVVNGDALPVDLPEGAKARTTRYLYVYIYIYIYI